MIFFMLVTVTICNTLWAIMITMSKVRYQMKAKERAIWWNYATNACNTYLVSQKEWVRPNNVPSPYESSYILEIFRTCLSSYGTTYV